MDLSGKLANWNSLATARTLNTEEAKLRDQINAQLKDTQQRLEASRLEVQKLSANPYLPGEYKDEQGRSVLVPKATANDPKTFVPIGSSKGEVTQQGYANEIAKMAQNDPLYATDPAAAMKNAAKAYDAALEQAGIKKPWQQNAPAPRSGPNADAIAALKQHPEMRGDFDTKYGAGAAAQVLGP